MRRSLYATMVLLVPIMVGCNHYGALNKDYGNSYHAAISGQTLNPGASKNLKPVTGLPGAVADGVMKKYAESFASADCAAQKAPALVMPLLSPGAAGAGQDGYGKK